MSVEPCWSVGGRCHLLESNMRELGTRATENLAKVKYTMCTYNVCGMLVFGGYAGIMTYAKLLMFRLYAALEKKVFRDSGIICKSDIEVSPGYSDSQVSHDCMWSHSLSMVTNLNSAVFVLPS